MTVQMFKGPRQYARNSNDPCHGPFICHEQACSHVGRQDGQDISSPHCSTIFLFKQACPDIQTAVMFLMTHIQWPDVDHCKKLRGLVWYLHVTA